MKRIAIFGTNDTFMLSAGIRAILGLLYNALSELGYEVDFIVSSFPCKIKNSRFPYFSRIVFQKDIIDANFFTHDDKIETKLDLIKRLLPFKKQRRKFWEKYEVFATDVSRYDIVISATHFITPELSGRYYGRIVTLFHDFLPLILKFTKKSSNNHPYLANYGLNMTMKQGGNIICVSKAAKDQLILTYQNASFYDIDKIRTLPQAIAPLFYKTDAFSGPRKRAIVFGGDIGNKRKRVDYVVEIVKRLQNLDEIYLYDSGNCRNKILFQFFTQSSSKTKVHFYNSVSNKTLVEIFDRAKILLFPSDYEGIGLPIIEAQVMGCRVAVQNKSPMKDLALNGSCILTMNPEEDAKVIDTILLDDNFDNNALAKNARKKYSQIEFTDVVQDIITNMW